MALPRGSLARATLRVGFGSEILGRRQLGCVPAATQRFDQLNARHHLLFAETYLRLLSGEKHGLRGDHVQVWIEPGGVSYIGFPKAPTGRRNGRVLFLDRWCQHPERRQVILYLLERCQHRLPVIRSRRSVRRPILDRGPGSARATTPGAAR